MLILARKCGETLVIGDNIEITITEIAGDRVKIGIQAPKEITILRKELCQTAAVNQKAVAAVSSEALRRLAANFKGMGRPLEAPKPAEKKKAPEA